MRLFPTLERIPDVAALARSLEHPMEQDRSALATALSSGRPEVLDELIERYQHRLFRYLLSITGNRATAEDLFQETWIRVLERGHQYRSRWTFESWLFSIARHLAIDLARRRRAGSLDQSSEPDEGQGIEPADPGRSPLQELLASEGSAQISRGLARIAPLYREALLLRFQEQLSLEEIAEITGAPLSTVKARVYRGLEAMRRSVGET